MDQCVSKIASLSRQDHVLLCVVLAALRTGHRRPGSGQRHSDRGDDCQQPDSRAAIVCGSNSEKPPHTVEKLTVIRCQREPDVVAPPFLEVRERRRVLESIAEYVHGEVITAVLTLDAHLT
jgi:hypothetical protein